MGEMILNPEALQYIKIRLGEEMYGIDISYVDNIVRPQHVTRVPNVAGYIKGVINIRGEIVPIMSLRLKMGFEEIEETRDTRFIIIKMEQYGKIGLIVDAVNEVVTLLSTQIEKIKPNSKDESSHFVSAVGKSEDTLVSLLDLNTVVMEKTDKEE